MSSLLADQINSITNVYLNHILADIAKKYKIDEKELKEKYLGPAAVLPKKRGRKKRDNIVVKKNLDEQDTDEIIETEAIEWKGHKYLVDSMNNVYTHNLEEPVHIGERINGNIVIYGEEDDS